METESGKWKVVVLICISMAFHFPLFSFSPLRAQSSIGIQSTYAESHAAEQLKDFLEKGGCKTISGKRTDHAIHVGLAPGTKQRYQSIVDTLRDGGYFIIGDGRDIVLYGAGEKGTLYAVYAFLEKLDFRLYTPDAMVVPDLSKSIPLSHCGKSRLRLSRGILLLSQPQPALRRLAPPAHTGRPQQPLRHFAVPQMMEMEPAPSPSIKILHIII